VLLRALSGRHLLVLAPYIWLAALFLLPFAIVLKVSFSEAVMAIPPYQPRFDLAAGWEDFFSALSAFSLDSYLWLTEDSLYLRAYLGSLRIALIATFLTLLIGYPLAYGMALAPQKVQPHLMMLVILPFWTSFLIRIYAWIGILKYNGLLNALLLKIGVIVEPLEIMNTEIAVYIGIVYAYLPFMVLPIYSRLVKIDHSFTEAAADLGCSPLKTFWVVIFPLSFSGVIAGCFLVFIPSVGEFVIPELLGGADTLMVGRVLWNEFFLNRDWPVASAVAVLLLLFLILPIVAFQRLQDRTEEVK
jgi:putrescine transport system permease protein